VGSGESEAFETDEHKAYHESRDPKEDCGCATEEMGAGESEEGRLNGDHASSNPVFWIAIVRIASTEFGCLERRSWKKPVEE
jgi:hypothetical protein